MSDLRKVMAGQTLAQRPQSDFEKRADRAAIVHFGGLMAELSAGKIATAFKRGYIHALQGVTAHRGNCPHYDLGFGAGV